MLHPVSVPKERDPLSVQYDSWARRVLAEMQADPYGWHSTRIPSPPGDPVDARGCTRHERAALRSLYYQLNYSPSVGRWVKNTEWSLQTSWGERTYAHKFLFFGRGESTRALYRRIVPGGSASRAVRSKPREAYTLHPELRADALNL
jgi:hypothetical protein